MDSKNSMEQDLSDSKDVEKQYIFENPKQVAVISEVGSTVSAATYDINGNENLLNGDQSSKLLEKLKSVGKEPMRIITGVKNFISEIDVKDAVVSARDSLNDRFKNLAHKIDDKIDKVVERYAREARLADFKTDSKPESRRKPEFEMEGVDYGSTKKYDTDTPHS